MWFFKKKKLENLVYKFVDKLENKKIKDEKLYKEILKEATAWNKVEVLNDIVRNILTFQDYDENEVNFNYQPFLERLRQNKLD